MIDEIITNADLFEINVVERIKFFELKFKFSSNNIQSYNLYTNIFNFVPSRDDIKIYLTDDSEESLILDRNTSPEKYAQFINNLLYDDTVSVRVEINKEIVDNRFSIYSFDEFSKDLTSLSLENIMATFSNLLKEVKSYLIFDVFSDIPIFTTKTLFFIPHGNLLVNSNLCRSDRLQSCKEISYFYNMDRYELLPDDFNIQVDYENNPLSKIFNQLEVILSACFIASTSSISDGNLRFQINGQRMIEYNFQLSQVSPNPIIYKIYDWIFMDGNCIDKSIIARNVISLHCKYTPFIDIDDKIIGSIRSNYNLYLKDNVVQYLELKNKVAGFIVETVSKTGEYATALLDKFKTNLIAIFGFLFTVVLANIVSDQPLNNIFTKDITNITEFVLFCSFVYLIICLFQSKYEIDKAYKSYEYLKDNYKTILTNEDILEIFDNDSMIIKVKRSIRKSQVIYIVCWIIFLLLALFVVETLSEHPNFSFFYEHFLS